MLSARKKHVQQGKNKTKLISDKNYFVGNKERNFGVVNQKNFKKENFCNELK